jgi:flavodoxin I
MKKAVIIYWSGTGNTQKMAAAILEGVTGAGAEVKLLSVDKAKLNDVMNADIVALGCPSMGAEVLEEIDMEPFISLIEKKCIKDKKIVLFGSYGWGNGEWMEEWENRMKKAGAILIEKGLILQESPDNEGIKKCRELGEKLVKS